MQAETRCVLSKRRHSDKDLNAIRIKSLKQRPDRLRTPDSQNLRRMFLPPVWPDIFATIRISRLSEADSADSSIPAETQHFRRL